MRTGLSFAKGALACLLALVVLAPSVGAFSSSDVEVDVAYAFGALPMVIGAGMLDVDAQFSGAVLVAGLNDTAVGPVRDLVVTDRDPATGLPRERTYRDVMLVAHSGTLLWRLDEGETLPLVAKLSYAMGVGLPEADFAQDGSGATPPPGLLLAARRMDAAATWSQGEAQLFLLDATVSLQDLTGRSLPGWDRERVNAGARPGSEPEDGTLFTPRGPFEVRFVASALAGQLRRDATTSMGVAPSDVNEFVAASESFSAFGAAFSEPGEGFDGRDNPLDALAPLSGLLNGAVLLIAQSPNGTDAPEPLAATLDGKDATLSTFSLLRSKDVAASWTEGEMRVQGTATYAVTADGFAVEDPARIGFLPVLSAFLWALALAAIVLYFVKRPPKGVANWKLRVASGLINLVVLVAVFWLWDVSFAQTFGTSFLQEATAQGFTSETIPRLGTLLGVQLLPWSIAGLFFALPVRIAAGVGLRYLGRGKSFKGLANTAGLVALALLGPLYAMWLLDLVLGGILAALPMAFGGP